MKNILRKLVLRLLKKMAKKRMKKFKGKVIAVTGSVGKTSTKDAIYTVLNSQFKVKRSGKSMNTDFGMLLTILDIESGYSNALKWSWLLVKAFYNSRFPDHSEVLLLELGVDKPGDMDFLLSVVKPDVAVMTSIAPVHLAEGQFKDLKDIFEEKKKAVDALGENGMAVLNVDNPFLSYLAKGRGKKGTITFGKKNEANCFASAIKQSVEGMSFVFNFRDKKYEVKANVLGEYQVYVLMPALICADLMGMDMENAILALERYVLPPGRMTIIPAKEGATILDSSYNSSPEALKEALKVLGAVGEGKRKVAVLGNMNELGDEAASLHKMIGEIVPEYADVLLTVGGDAKLIAEKAEEKGMDSKNIHTFRSAPEAAEYFVDKVKKKDVILVKGSQNRVRLERFVKELMANPDDAKELLVRQERVWEAKL